MYRLVVNNFSSCYISLLTTQALLFVSLAPQLNPKECILAWSVEGCRTVMMLSCAVPSFYINLITTHLSADYHSGFCLFVIVTYDYTFLFSLIHLV